MPKGEQSVSPPKLPEPLLTARELADYLRVPVNTVHKWRYRGEGPPAHKVGHQLRFRLAEVDAWIAGASQQPRTSVA